MIEELGELEDLPPAEGGGGSSSKKMLIIGALLFLVMNVAWGVVFLVSSSSPAEAAAPANAEAAPAPPTPEQAEAAADAVADAADAEEREKSKPGPIFKMAPFVVNLDEPRGSHYLRIAVELEVRDEESKAQVEERLVILRDRFISALSAKRIADLTRPQDKDALREELLDLARDTMKSRAVRAVYFTEFLTQ